MGRQGNSPIRGNVAKRQKGCRFRRKAVPYGNTGNVCVSIVGDGFLHVPKRYLYINLKFGQPFYPNNPIFPLELPAAASPQIMV